MRTTVFGIVVTVFYIALVLSIRWSSLSTLRTMPLNEFGDFFAGVFGPLMLFWLILGYIQQHRELRQNTKALEIQAEELKNSVEQYKELVKTTKLQAETDMMALEIKQEETKRLSLPYFSIIHAGRHTKSGQKYKYVIKIQNSGQAASDVNFSTAPRINQIESNVIHFFENGKTYSIDWDSETCGHAPKNLKFIIKCKDANLRQYIKSFDLLRNDEHNYSLVKADEAIM